MLSGFYDIARPLLLLLSPEQAHEATLKALESGLYPRPDGADPASLQVNVAGLALPNPIGIAAGFDKDARVPDAVLGLGCGFAEIGSVTPLAQSGNPRPRVFRLIRDRAIINRLGFNNAGHAAALERLSKRARIGIVGVNVGANKDASDRAADYVAGIEAFYDVASYFTVNISSPNTPGLRDLQAPGMLDELMARVMAAREAKVAAGRPRVPVFVKIAPDIAEEDLQGIVERLIAHAADAIAVSNTTLARDGLTDTTTGREAGGLSGRPLFHRATVTLARVYQLTTGRVPLIGIGGITSPETALEKIEAGATLVQLYTGLVYEGPGLIGRIKAHLADAVAKAGVAHVSDLTGRQAAAWAARPLVA
ncbi:MAG: quinone-dependent dihydroorotate dehydrogenase [Hyphomicrobiaceae bacterium]